jgi:hypothetical protein
MGRPADEEQPRTGTVAVRLTPKQLAAVDRGLGRLTRSAYLRRLLEQDTSRA